ncbi:MAG: lysophospholipid acyltransferase family protein [Pseudomonadales bacterium]|jgi:KDO2-lipid IV(A) lauroyltransferase|nr:lysophospholipid acyltransferase family protein [Pseudomonadales bacterium]
MRLLFAERFGDALARRPRLLDLVWRLEAGVMHGLWWTLRALGPERASRLGSRLLRVLGPRSRKKAPLVRDTLRLIRPDASERELAELVDRSWNNLGAVFGEYAHLDRIGAPDRLAIDDRVGLERYVRRERSAVFFGAHHANWELMALALAREGVPLVALYAPIQNPYLDRLMGRARSQLGCGTHPRGASIRPLLRHLREGGAIGTLIDLRVSEGSDLPFLGRPTRLPDAAARLALGTGCDLVPIRIERTGTARYRCTIGPVLPVDDLRDGPDAVAAVTRRMVALVEDWIREEPALWLAANRRWDKAVLAEAAAAP